MFSPEEDGEILAAPLLGGEGNFEGESDNGVLGLHQNMETTPGTSSTSASPADMILSSGPLANPVVRRAVYWALGVRTMADILPSAMMTVLHSGKFSVLVFVAVHLILLSLWLPFWVLSFALSETGVYALAVGVVFLVGRGIVRMIALPGASSRLSSEIEHEFAKYSVKIILASCAAVHDFATAIHSAGPELAVTKIYENIVLWKQAKSYRDKVLAVFAEVLNYILNDGLQSTHPSSPELTKYGNNRLSGDVGDLSRLTPEARTDGKFLLEKLGRVLFAIENLELQVVPLLEKSSGRAIPISSVIKEAASAVLTSISDLRDFAESLRPASGETDSADSDNEDDEELHAETMRRRLEGQNETMIGALKSGFASILPMLDPPPHTSIFGFDLQRGCMLSRYRGARQLWVQRPSGGMIDVIHIPAKTNAALPSQRNTKAVLYCNPNAGLNEVAAGMSLSGGNVHSPDNQNVASDSCWTDFYTNLGFDIYLFNYAGFSRSYGTGYFGVGKRGGEEAQGTLSRISRIICSIFIGFKPTPETLREDGLAVGTHILTNLGVNQLIIHGESIGGVAASATARQLSASSLTSSQMSLLICDRTFCNLEATAQRLVGGWSGYAIRMLAPLWSTDVARDFVATACPKVVANDAADMIIFDSASLKSGVAYWKEIYRGIASTKGIGWMMDAPIHYRMAVDYENVCVADSKYATSGLGRRTAPVWPADKHISLEEGFYFAACVKRIGKVASLEKRKFAAVDPEAATGNWDCPAPIYQVWKYLGTCEGLCGSPLGTVVRGGYDVTIAWLCSTLTFGGQVIVESMEHRHQWTEEQAWKSAGQLGQVQPVDFDCRPPGYQAQESETVIHPKPIPEVLAEMTKLVDSNPNDQALKSVHHEISFVVGTLQYVIARLSSPNMIEASWKTRHLHSFGTGTVGSFLNLHCGHNNPFSPAERKRLRSLLTQATSQGATN